MRPTEISGPHYFIVMILFDFIKSKAHMQNPDGEGD